VIKHGPRYLVRLIKPALKFYVLGQLLVELHVGCADRAQRLLHVGGVRVCEQEAAAFVVRPIELVRHLLCPSDAEALFEAVHRVAERLVPAQDRQELRLVAPARVRGERKVFQLRVLREKQSLRSARLRRAGSDRSTAASVRASKAASTARCIQLRDALTVDRQLPLLHARAIHADTAVRDIARRPVAVHARFTSPKMFPAARLRLIFRDEPRRLVAV